MPGGPRGSRSTRRRARSARGSTRWPSDRAVATASVWDAVGGRAHAGDLPAGQDRERRHRGPRTDAGEVLVAPEDVGGAVLVGLGRREDRAGEAADRVVERAVLGRARRLGELDVVDDLARPRGGAARRGRRRATSAGRASAAVWRSPRRSRRRCRRPRGRRAGRPDAAGSAARRSCPPASAPRVSSTRRARRPPRPGPPAARRGRVPASGAGSGREDGPRWIRGPCAPGAGGRGSRRWCGRRAGRARRRRRRRRGSACPHRCPA